jgi:hypothetical protein
MANIPFKRPILRARFTSGKAVPDMLNKLNLSGIDVIWFRSYQFRTKTWRVEGYNPSQTIEEKNAIRSREYRLNMNGFKAWKIGLRNNHQVPVDIKLHFTMHSADGLAVDFTETCIGLLPSKCEEIQVVPVWKTAQVKLDTVEIYADSRLLSISEVNSFIPFPKWSFAISSIIACLLGVSFLFISSKNKLISVEHIATTLIYIVAFYLAFWETFNITPVIIMFILLVIAPFFLHDPVHISGLIVFGCLYFWAVWCKRSSIKDFLFGAFIP